MAHPLLRKQFMEAGAFLTQNKEKGTRRTRGKIIELAILYLIIAGVLGASVYYMAEMMCEALVAIGFGWLYHMSMSTSAVVLGLFASMFNISGMVYQAKDNDMLLAMPIKPWKLLAARLFSVWCWILIYEAVVYVPSMMVYYKVAYKYQMLKATTVLCNIGMYFSLSILILSLSCLLGFLVSLISQKVKGNSMVKVVLSLAFIALYYYLYMRAYSVIQQFLSSASAIGGKVKGAAYPLYLVGKAGSGDGAAVGIITGVVIIFFAIVWLVMKATFIQMATKSQARKRKKFSLRGEKGRSQQRTLRYKEEKRFLGSAVYMLNSGLGVIVIPILGILLLVKKNAVLGMLTQLEMTKPGTSMLVLIAGLWMVAIMNEMTAASVSLEGKTIWILQSLPVDLWKVLKAKIALQLEFTVLPVLFCSVCMMIVSKPVWYYGLLMILLPQLFALLVAQFGLFANLLWPNLKWTSETAVIKQSMPMLVSMFGSMIFVALLAGAYLLLSSVVTTLVFLLIVAVLLVSVNVVLWWWLKKKGTARFRKL